MICFVLKKSHSFGPFMCLDLVPSILFPDSVDSNVLLQLSVPDSVDSNVLLQLSVPDSVDSNVLLQLSVCFLSARELTPCWSH